MYQNKTVCRMISLMLVITLTVVCGIFSAGASIVNPDRIAPMLEEKIAAEPEAKVQVFVERKAAPLTVEDMPSYDSADRGSLTTARNELAATNKELNQKFVDELAQYASFTLDANTITNIVALTITAKDVYALLKCDDVFFIDYMGDDKYVNESAESELSKIDEALSEIIAAQPDAMVQVFVERKAAPLTVEDMPSYDSADRGSLYTARNELAATNKELNQKFVDELARYADFTFDANTITNIVALTLKAQDVRKLAACDNVFSIDYMGDAKFVSTVGVYKLPGDTDGDLSVTILDATGIQMELAELNVNAFDADCADYDADGNVTVLDATGIQVALTK